MNSRVKVIEATPRPDLPTAFDEALWQTSGPAAQLAMATRWVEAEYARRIHPMGLTASVLTQGVKSMCQVVALDVVSDLIRQTGTRGTPVVNLEVRVPSRSEQLRGDFGARLYLMWSISPAPEWLPGGTE